MRDPSRPARGQVGNLESGQKGAEERSREAGVDEEGKHEKVCDGLVS